MKILFAVAECVPFLATGGLGDVAGSLPPVLNRLGEDCRVVLPLYGGIPDKYRSQFRFVTSFTVQLSWRKQYCGVFETQLNGTTYYFLDNEYYYKRDEMYGYGDDAERFAFFGKAVLELIAHLDFLPDILHANDWQAAMAIPYLNYFYRGARGCGQLRSVFTIHNIQYQGQFDLRILSDVLGIPYFASGMMEYDGCINMMKAALEESDRITTVSPTYAREILTPWYGYGLDRFLQQRQYKLTGILNGIDQELYNPSTDPHIFTHYDAASIPCKRENKIGLQKHFELEQDNSFLVGLVTRMVDQKGLDLVEYSLARMVEEGVQFVIVGSGEGRYEEFFRYCGKKYPGRVAVHLGYSVELAHKTYAGVDAFLMPSRSEPCGLAQMIALRYGCVPVVRKTGGLADTVRDVGGEGGNGFVFANYNADEMFDAVMRAKALFEGDSAAWEALMKSCMECDCSWDRSAHEYIALYRQLAPEGC